VAYDSKTYKNNTPVPESLAFYRVRTTLFRLVKGFYNIILPFTERFMDGKFSHYSAWRFFIHANTHKAVVHQKSN
jgi:hypothetical protein